MNNTQIQEYAAEILQKIPAGVEAEVSLYGQEEGLTRYANNVITQNVYSENIEVTLRVLKNQKVARVTSDHLERRSTDSLVRRALALLEYQPATPDLLNLPGPQRYQSLERYDEALSTFDASQKVDILGRVAATCQAHKTQANGTLGHTLTHLHLANTQGLSADHRWSQVSFALIAKTPTSTGKSESTVVQRSLLQPDLWTREAVDEALRSQNPVEVEPQKFDVILRPGAVANLMEFLTYQGLSTLAILEKRSILSEFYQKPVFSPWVTIVDDVHHPQSTGIPFDFEGMPRQKVDLVKEGVFVGMVHDRKTARKAGAPSSTGHALPEPNSYGPFPLNLVFQGGNHGLSEMIESTERGLLINDFHYCNLIDAYRLLQTGMTRHGVYLIEKGRVVNPVKNMRFTQGILEALKNVTMVSRETEFIHGFFGGGAVLPTVKVKDFNFSSETSF